MAHFLQLTGVVFKGRPFSGLAVITLFAAFLAKVLHWPHTSEPSVRSLSSIEVRVQALLVFTGVISSIEAKSVLSSLERVI